VNGDENSDTARTTSAREPGEYSFRVVSRRMTIVFIVTALALIATGVAVALGGHAGIVISLLALVAAMITLREADGRRLDVFSHLKGYRGEHMVADLLGMLEPFGYRVIHGIEFVDDKGHTMNIDHTVVGPTGVFAIETKNWNGRMWKTEGDRLLHNGVDETRRVGQTASEAIELKRRLNAAHIPVRWVEGVLVSTKSTLPDVRVDFRCVTLIGASDLVPFIRDRESFLTDAQIASAVAAIT
jgi:hypothetical protein